MAVLVTGGSGFIGGALVKRLQRAGYKVLIIDHKELNLTQTAPPVELLESVEAVIHLAGLSIFQSWTPAVKRAIYDSRVLSTRLLVRAIGQLKQRPKVLVTASASGYYGDRGEIITDESAPAGSDFLAKVCVDWEAEARQAEAFGLRTVQVRTAPVIGRGGLVKLLLPWYQVGLGPILGGGQQWFSWISLDDLAAIYQLALENPNIRGPVNATSPQSVRQIDFAQTFGQVLDRPVWLRLPKWSLRLVLNELADSALVSQHVKPKKLAQLGFSFALPTLKPCLEQALEV